ncbi:endonuclease/exonuclease/phosphatase family protein [Prosthecobacter dejongeii]|uniref:Endonuclease/exonuclease/phosphatase family metal-dependent hydrolase n=1 Tax=Prosthecobacter dejongeii TaxID=48465 RepID=A0A7W7YP54_9BACT|nr:endonuclease/exonuclease/phosphatase family protein [Prosthecobacter dejongeii]MBB5039674.1 endonuclease/exonuclease/phosphatase family metal-dependent hydrolase [Prosthecobacter dejongeii]
MVRLCFFIFISGVLCSCGTHTKKNISKTIVESRSPAVGAFSQASFPRYQETEFLSFAELKQLVKNPLPGGALEAKVQRLLNRPIISNEAYYRGMRPTRAQNATLGDSLRVATWNVEKSLRMKEVAAILKSQTGLEDYLDPKASPKGSAAYVELLRERERLATADVIVLQEMDIGISRSGYRDAARDLALALGMNYAYAPQQLEIDPVLLGLESVSDGRGGDVRHQPDEARYKGVFGLAVLSRYPIKSAQSFQLKAQPYDWHAGEKAGTDLAEGARRLATEIVFENQIVREMKVGGRIFFRVDLDVPGLPDNTLSVVNNHLEIKARPKDREAQMVEILSYIQPIRHTVIMAGDHNSAQSDLSPTSVTRIFSRTTSNPQTWLGVSMDLLMAAPAAVNSGRVLLNTAKNFHSPMALHIPVVLPNKTRGLFARIEEFRFADGGAFDFRGDKERSINRSGAKLANSNEKAIKGQTPTFSVKRPIGPIGRSRLDWIFVKAPAAAQSGEESYRLAPHFGETLTGLLEGLTVRLSDHNPCVVDLPLQEPPGI